MAEVYRPQRQYAMSLALKESPYGSAQTVDHEFFDIADSTPPVEGQTVTNMSNRSLGREGPTDALLLGKWRTWRLDFDLVKPSELAIALGLFYGAPDTSTVDISGQQHDFSHSDADYTLPSVTLEEYFTSTKKNGYTGVVLNSWSITGSADGENRACKLTMEGFCKATYTTAWTDVNAAIAVETVNMQTSLMSVFFGTAGTVNTQNAWTLAEMLNGTPDDETAKIRSFTFGGSNNISTDMLMAIGGGDEFTRATRGQRTFDLSIQLEMQDSVTQAAEYQDWLVDQEKKAIQIMWDSGEAASDTTYNYGAVFVWPEVEIVGATISEGATGKFMVDLACQPYNYSDGTTIWGPLMATVWNKVAAYLA